MALPTTEERVAAEETKLGVRLPSEYRNRLISQNGGELDTAEDVWQIFPVFDNTDQKRAKRTANHIYRETLNARQWRGFPEGAVAVAANGTGDLLVFLAESEDRLNGRLQHWNHESAEITPTPLEFN